MSGGIPTFNEVEEDWDSYQERLESHFAVKDVANALKVHMLITGLQASQYQVLKNLLAPAKPSSKYLAGRKFEAWTDHKPLLGLLGEKRGIPAMASGRIIRWALTLAGYDYNLKYVPGAKISNADCLSRFPMKSTDREVPDVGEEVLLVEHMDYNSITADDIRRWTDREPTLSKVRQAILSGWKSVDTSEPDVQPYYTRRDELSVLKGCILWGSRVVMPPQGRERITDELHSTHPGIVKMKSLARAYMWWPNMDKDLERKVNSCRECQTVRVMKNNCQPLHPWEYPDRAWSRLHIDYAVEQHVRSKQEMQAKNYGGKKKEYEEGDHVYFKNILHGMNESGVVIENTGPTSCRIRREDGVIVRKHFDQMMKQTVPADSRGEVVQEEFSEQVNERILPETVREQIEGQRPRCERVVKQRAELVPEPELESRRSMRIKKPVEKLDI